MIELVKTNRGESLGDLSKNSKVMLIFLRHFGCTFCREGLTDLLKVKSKLEAENVVPVIVHQSSDRYASQVMDVYNLGKVHRISDPHLELYSFFSLQKGSLNQIFGPKMMWRFIVAGLFKGHLVGKEEGDGWQMPGVFIIEKGEVINKFVHQYAGDRPDYLTLARTSLPVREH